MHNFAFMLDVETVETRLELSASIHSIITRNSKWLVVGERIYERLGEFHLENPLVIEQNENIFLLAAR
jgi:hypothetical protein